jgi:hypothetical protein
MAPLPKKRKHTSIGEFLFFSKHFLSLGISISTKITKSVIRRDGAVKFATLTYFSLKNTPVNSDLKYGDKPILSFLSLSGHHTS